MAALEMAHAWGVLSSAHHGEASGASASSCAGRQPLAEFPVWREVPHRHFLQVFSTGGLLGEGPIAAHDAFAAVPKTRVRYCSTGPWNLDDLGTRNNRTPPAGIQAPGMQCQ